MKVELIKIDEADKGISLEFKVSSNILLFIKIKELEHFKVSLAEDNETVSFEEPNLRYINYKKSRIGYVPLTVLDKFYFEMRIKEIEDTAIRIYLEMKAANIQDSCAMLLLPASLEKTFNLVTEFGALLLWINQVRSSDEDIYIKDLAIVIEKIVKEKFNQYINTKYNYVSVRN